MYRGGGTIFQIGMCTVWTTVLVILCGVIKYEVLVG